MQLTLLIPELIWPEPDDRDAFDDLDCPALNLLLARSRMTRRPPQSLEATLADAFGHAEGAPYAAFRLLGETADAQVPTVADNACWLCSDPVHLRFHRESLILADSGSFDITLEEAQSLTDELNHHFSAVGPVVHFHAATADRWYLQLDSHASLDHFEAPPLSAVAGRSVERLLTASSHAQNLRQLLVDAQMLLHAHATNQKRECEGRMPINSLWLWGAGILPQRVESPFDGVWSTNPLALGLARAAGVPAHPAPADANTLFAHAARDTCHLVVLEDLLAAVHYENGEAYRVALAGPNGLEKRWFAPLRKALANGRITDLCVEATTAYGALDWQCRRSDQLKLWRRPQPLGKLAQHLAKEAA